MTNEELMPFDMPEKRSSMIKVIGVGGGGGNAVNHMLELGIKDVDFVLCNSDKQALDSSKIPLKIQLGATLTQGLGCGNNPEMGKKSAIESIDEIKEILGNNTKMIFITAGMGGGTGTGAAPIIAQAASEMDILTVAIVSIPFRFEGPKRKNQAIEGINELSNYVDSLLVVNNERIREFYGNLPFPKAFAHANDILATAAKSIAEIITVPGYMNVDFADVKTVMSKSGVALMGSATAEGEERAAIAVKGALNSPLLNDNDIKGAKNILLNITSGTEEITMDEIGQINDFIQQSSGASADLITGIVHDETIGNKISVTIIATGFTANSIPEIYVTAKPSKKLSLDDTCGISFRDQAFLLDKETGNAPEQRTFEFDLTQESSEDIFLTNNDPESPKQTIEKHSNNIIIEHPTDNIIEKLEKTPAYMRKDVKIDPKKISEGLNISRASLKEEDEHYTKLKSNNSFLHDNVD